MKFQIASAFILSSSAPLLVNGLCLKDALAGQTLNTGDGVPCSFGNVKNLLRRKMNTLNGCGNLNQEILDLFNVRKFNQAKSIIQEACAAADVTDEEPNGSLREVVAGLSITNDVDGTLDDSEAQDRFLKEFYDGNTFLNQHVGGGDPRINDQALVQDDELSYSIPGQAISELYQKSKSGIIEWPSEDIENFQINDESCTLNTVMCCWVTDRYADGNGDGNCEEPYPRKMSPEGSNCIDSDPADNTDICYADHNRSPGSSHVAGGFTIYPDEDEGDAHCHGFVFSNEESHESALYKANNLFYVSIKDHLKDRGYVRNVPGAPMCGCLEQMPSVSRSDCTHTVHTLRYNFEFDDEVNLLASVGSRRVSFESCPAGDGNDLEAQYLQMVEDDLIDDNTEEFSKYVVGEDNCEDATSEFLASQGITSARR